MRPSRSTNCAANAVAGREVDLTDRQDGSGALTVLLGDRVVPQGPCGKIASALQGPGTVPRIAAQLCVIGAVLETGPDDGAWTGADPVWLETVRRTLQDLLSLIEKRKRHFVHPDGEDVRGELTDMDVEA